MNQVIALTGSTSKTGALSTTSSFDPAGQLVRLLVGRHSSPGTVTRGLQRRRKDTSRAKEKKRERADRDAQPYDPALDTIREKGIVNWTEADTPPCERIWRGAVSLPPSIPSGSGPVARFGPSDSFRKDRALFTGLEHRPIVSLDISPPYAGTGHAPRFGNVK
jgi:hypothetical protein